jgi:hypothetical protein
MANVGGDFNERGIYHRIITRQSEERVWEHIGMQGGFRGTYIRAQKVLEGNKIA